MESPSEQESGNLAKNLSSSVELIARSVAGLLAIMYGVGLLVLSIHEAKFGILQFSPLRTRILFVGFTFLTLAALPAAASYYEFSYFGPLRPIVENTDSATETQRGLVLSAGFFVTASLIAGFVYALLFVHQPSEGGRLTLLWGPLSLVALTAFIFLFYYFARTFPAHPSRVALLSWLAAAIMFAAFYALDHKFSALIAWMWVVSIVFGRIQGTRDKLRYFLDYRSSFELVLMFALYAYLFGSMEARYGGGAPTRITLYLSKPAPLLPSGATTGSLIDETDQGFYVLADGKDKALFIPRSGVDFVYFGSSDGAQKVK
ncbi:MAG TPA: hypothetical protein VKG25_22665 [Bryobacteraceae bacterium]|nr:hypothetical protein [Bryobacteraceae bacterium]